MPQTDSLTPPAEPADEQTIAGYQVGRFDPEAADDFRLRLTNEDVFGCDEDPKPLSRKARRWWLMVPTMAWEAAARVAAVYGSGGRLTGLEIVRANEDAHAVLAAYRAGGPRSFEWSALEAGSLNELAGELQEASLSGWEPYGEPLPMTNRHQGGLGSLDSSAFSVGILLRRPVCPEGGQ